MFRLKAFEVSLASSFAALTALGAYIYIPLPFTPVPITLQTFFVYFAAVLLGGKLAALSQAIYLLLGVVGLPVFAGGRAGFGVLLGPTGGYLIGFVAAAYVAGRIAGGGGFLRGLAALIVATVIIYGLGILQLWVSMNTFYGEGLGLAEAALMGTVPFIFGDLLKIFAVLCLLRSVKISALRRVIRTVKG